VYDKAIQKNLLDYLIKLLNLSRKDHLIPGGRIHNFKDFMEFPMQVFEKRPLRENPFVHPLFTQPVRILDVLNTRDVMLHFPYHSFDSIIDLLREAAIDPYVETIKITCYRLAKDSKIVSALINALRNGKKVTVVLELKARFDEEANLKWKKLLEEEGVRVLVGLPDRKIHAKLCLITKRVGKSIRNYGFVSTGNLNESTAKIYGDHCLLTADKRITADISNVFKLIEFPTHLQLFKKCKTLLVSPYNTRSFFIDKIKNEIKLMKAGKPAACTIKLNSLTDIKLIDEIYHAAQEGLDLKMIVRGICTANTENKKWPKPIQAISIVDQFLEHARIFYFKNGGKEDIFISSADWMVRNLDYRIEATAPVFDETLKEELKHILEIQLAENEKARILDNEQVNKYVHRDLREKHIRSQVSIYNYLRAKKYS
jgi:polyphosphate kinase